MEKDGPEVLLVLFGTSGLRRDATMRNVVLHPLACATVEASELGVRECGLNWNCGLQEVQDLLRGMTGAVRLLVPP